MATTSTELMLAQDIAGFYDDPLGFVMYAYPWGKKGTILEHFDGPDVWQREFLTKLGEEIRQRGFDGKKPVTPIRMGVKSGHGIGKSALFAMLANFIMSTRPMAKGVVSASKFEQLWDKTWTRLAEWQKLSITAHWFEVRTAKNNLIMYRVGAKDEWKMSGQAAKKENKEGFAGQHNHISTSFYIFDEGSGIDEEIFETAEGGLTDGEPMIFVFGNPTRNSGYFYHIFGKLRHLWHTRTVDSRDAAIPNKDLIQQWIETYGLDSDFVRVRVRGLFPMSGSKQFIAKDLIEAAKLRRLGTQHGAPKILGVDVARYGDDKTVFAMRQGLKLHPLKSFSGLDTVEVAREVLLIRKQWRPDLIIIDATGVGAGVCDQLKTLKVQHVEYHGASKIRSPEYEHILANRRIESWWFLRDWLKAADIPADEALIDELLAMEYTFTRGNSKELMILERKEDMKKRGLSSPDHADALALTFSEDPPLMELLSGMDDHDMPREDF